VPRQVDHAVRRRQLAEALWRVVRRDGIHQVSVRTVAAEAGTSPSALRHYFATQDELLGFALTAMIERVRDRVLPGLPGLRGRDGALRVLEELLPLDPRRRDEVAVYLAFLNRGGRDPRLRALRDDADVQSRAAVERAVEVLAEAGELGAGRDVATETDRLYPLLDGLTLHGALWPGAYPPGHLRAVLRAHLDELRRPAG
jgi:AcrR family transcriptional regulator